ncbi:ABC transporter permease [Roseococcus sp. YIM B11640]|uniref:ABC transporter permease n=1 Tax=Roseococcus sp. YIM B11640 TaxID=3133973 RepID=UPI003C7B6634
MSADPFQAETQAGRLLLRFSGPLDTAAAVRHWEEAHRKARGAGAVTLDASGVTALDSGGAALLVSLAGPEAEWHEPTDATARGVLDRFRSGLGPPAAPQRHHHRHFRPITALGAWTVGRFRLLLARLDFFGEAAVTTAGLTAKPWQLRWSEVLRHLDEAGTRAFGLCLLIGTLFGVILAFQSSVPMRQFGAEIFIPQLVGISVTRELGPLLAGVVLAGRTGSSYAAELGTMRVNEEVDALRTMGLDPMAWLLVPRIVASTLVMPALSMVMNISAIIGMGFVMAGLGFPPIAVANQLEQWLSLGDLAGGLGKSAIFGLAIGYVGCRCGLNAGAGPRAVGDAATGAVVGGIISLVLLDGIFAVLFFRLGW